MSEVSNNELMELISKMYSDTTNKLDGLTKEVKNLSNQVNENTKSIIKIENDLSKKVDILFEARDMDKEKLESINIKLDKLIEKTDRQDFEITLVKKANSTTLHWKYRDCLRDWKSHLRLKPSKGIFAKAN